MLDQTHSAELDGGVKTSKWLLSTCGVALALACPAQNWDWYEQPGQDLQFGISALVSGQPEQDPSVFGSFPYSFGLTSYYGGGWGQTFTVASLRTLQSIDLILGPSSDHPGTGEFELAIYRFNPLSVAQSEKLGFIVANAGDYRQVPFPVSSFDFSNLNLSLSPAETYAWSVTPKPGFFGALAFASTGLQNQDIYPGGTAFSLIPEPGALSIGLLGAVVCMFHRCR